MATKKKGSPKKADDTKKTAGSVYQITITLLYSPYPAWRRLLVPADINFEKFIHLMIVAMGWDDYHMHNFSIDGMEYEGGVQGLDALLGMSMGKKKPRNAAKEKLSSVLQKGQTGILEYDFGDGWEHLVKVEDVFAKAPEGVKVPCCLEGQGACPPEDCGGIPGLEVLVELMENPALDRNHYDELMEWLGGVKFDKNEFDPREVNMRILRS